VAIWSASVPAATSASDVTAASAGRPAGSVLSASAVTIQVKPLEPATKVPAAGVRASLGRVAVEPTETQAVVGSPVSPPTVVRPERVSPPHAVVVADSAVKLPTAVKPEPVSLLAAGWAVKLQEATSAQD
jgi:hypothetical protein